MINKALFSQDNKEWRTPKSLFNELNGIYHFKMDACTTEDNPLGTPFFCWKGGLDGLKQKWVGPVYCNPPYGRDIVKWIQKAVYEQGRGVTTVMLLPARTDTKWFHDYLYDDPYIEIRFIKGRLKFNDGKVPAPFPSMIVIFRPLQE